MITAEAVRSTPHGLTGEVEAIDDILGSVRRIAVFRALALGDMICATPALRALRLRFPQAAITLVGLPWAQEWAERQPSIDHFIVFPGHSEIPESKIDPVAWPSFLLAMREQGFDLVVQLHGSGRTSNGIVSEWSARHIAAFYEPELDAPEPALGMIWPNNGSETQRLLALVDGLGQQPDTVDANRLTLEFPLKPVDNRQAMALLKQYGLAKNDFDSYICIHPGSQLLSRRWPVERFAEVASALTEHGYQIVITGVSSETPLAAALQDGMAESAVNLVGKTTLWSLGSVIQNARLLICNDTGVSHVAAALGTPSVVVSSGADVSRWAPADEQRHPVLWSDQACRPCSYAVCPYEHECASAVLVSAVVQRALAVLAQYSWPGSVSGMSSTSEG